MRTTNFLPWRRARQAHCWRFWGLLFAFSALLTLILLISMRITPEAELQAMRERLTADTAIRQALENRNTRWRERLEQRQQPQDRSMRTSVTLSWRPLLMALGQAMPEQAWLTQIHYQQHTLMLTGYASSLSALVSLESALRQFTGFTFGRNGEMQQDTQGRWQFRYQLTQTEAAGAH